MLRICYDFYRANQAGFIGTGKRNIKCFYFFLFIKKTENACWTHAPFIQNQANHEKNNSFVICSLQPGVEKMLDKAGLLEIMNVTPTESEAWDIVQMEEIERELLGDFDSES